MHDSDLKKVPKSDNHWRIYIYVLYVLYCKMRIIRLRFIQLFIHNSISDNSQKF